MLAAIYNNNAVNRKKINEVVHYSKIGKHYILRNVYETKNYLWRQTILADIIESAGISEPTNLLTFNDFCDISQIPKRLSAIVKPNKEELVSKKFSRF